MKTVGLTSLLFAGAVLAAPPFPMPRLADVMRDSLTNKARIRWSKFVDDKKVQLTFSGGICERLNPNMSPEPARMPYDLPRNRELEKQVKAAHLGPTRAASSAPEARTLEILADGPKEWVMVGQWSMPLKSWKKKAPGLVALLEPLFDVQSDVFQNMKGPEK